MFETRINLCSNEEKTLIKLLEDLNVGTPFIPKEFCNLTLTDLVCKPINTSDFIVSAKVKEYNWDFILLAQSTQSIRNTPEYNYVFSLKIEKQFNLDEMKLFGKTFKELHFIGLNIQELVYAKEHIDKINVQKLNKIIKATLNSDKILLPEIDLDHRFRLIGKLAIAENQFEITLFIGLDEAKNVLYIANEAMDFRREIWYPAQYTFGPLTLRRIGLTYAEEKLIISLDALLSISGVQLALDGLGVKTPIDKWDPETILKGLSLEYVNNPLVISGGLLAEDNIEKYSGAVIVETLSRSFGAIASYDNTQSSPSMFVYLRIDEAIGGPPYFYITGMGFGFGINRRFKEPKLEEVDDAPLFLKNLSSSEALDKLEDNWIDPQIGTNWLAVGLDFSTFGFINSKALLIGQFGKEFEMLLLGLSTLKLPPKGPYYHAYIEMQMKGTWKPSEGFIGLTAMLNPNSYLFHEDCQLTGDYACWFWYDPSPQKGDFVISIGGYNPQFSVPSHYPVLARLGLNWPVGIGIIKGNAYFALTPSCIMAGGDLELAYEVGDIKAYVQVYAHLIVNWKPFHFDIKIKTSAGVIFQFQAKGKFLGIEYSCQKTLKFELEADVKLWGPATGGNVSFGNDYLRVDALFGSPHSDGEKVNKQAFIEMLPGHSNFVRIQAKRGLLPSKETETNKVWIVQPDEFEFVIDTGFPVLKFSHGNFDENESTKLYIRPLNAEVTQSHLTLIIKFEDNFEQEWLCKKIKTGVPEAMWGMGNKSQPTIKHVIGEIVRPKESSDSSYVGTINLHLTHGVEPVEGENGHLMIADFPHLPGKLKLFNNSREIISDTLNKKSVVKQRNLIIDELIKACLYQGEHDDKLIQLAIQAADLYTEPPLVLE